MKFAIYMYMYGGYLPQFASLCCKFNEAIDHETSQLVGPNQYKSRRDGAKNLITFYCTYPWHSTKLICAVILYSASLN